MSMLLSARGVAMHFGGVAAVDGVDFSVAEGELRGLIGPNGAGKSTFFKCLTGQLRPTAGTIFFRDRNITGMQRFAIARMGIGIKTQVPSLFDGLTVRESVMIALRRFLAEREARRRAQAILERFGLDGLAETEVGRLAHGQRQWVELAMVIAPEPALILLDEPTAGMSAEETRRTAALIRELNARHTLIVVEHDMAFIRAIAHTVTVLHQGRVLVEDEVAKVLADPRVQNVYLGRQVQPA
ncbi:MAG: ABC transporter ATP-binding protein [Acetobacteraceae bacterium]|nr:ABC transporter ATP-binding protein [Acetobacteraceae bacterium]